MQIALSDHDLANLILQRTGPFIKMGGQLALMQWFQTGSKQQLIAFLDGCGGKETFVKEVAAEIAAEFAQLEPHLRTASMRKIASIGPGNGFFELMVHRLIQPQISLIDIEKSEQHVHGFERNGSGYADLATCRNFLIANGADPADVTTCNPTFAPLPTQMFDGVISLLSMGFHYPCDQYLGFLRAQVRPGGLLILDKRRGTPDSAWDVLQEDFETAAAFPAPKSDRLVLRKRGQRPA